MKDLFNFKKPDMWSANACQVRLLRVQHYWYQTGVLLGQITSNLLYPAKIAHIYDFVQ
jgi:hypothetical protein